MMHEPEKSDSPIVAAKSANEPDSSGKESMERRGEAEGNTNERYTHRTQSRASVSPGLARVRERANDTRVANHTHTICNDNNAFYCSISRVCSR